MYTIKNEYVTPNSSHMNMKLNNSVPMAYHYLIGHVTPLSRREMWIKTKTKQPNWSSRFPDFWLLSQKVLKVKRKLQRRAVSHEAKRKQRPSELHPVQAPSSSLTYAFYRGRRVSPGLLQGWRTGSVACRGTEERPDKSPGYSAVFSCVFFFLVFFFKKALTLFSRSESHILQCDASPEEVGGEVEGGGGVGGILGNRRGKRRDHQSSLLSSIESGR